uniref:Putative WW domain-binding protein 4 n=1 Tax=Davidia involucrata TaxID=16924 RepID=A0A5B6ZKE1_DAVIN
MTEYWVSQGNKWCDFCKIFISNNPTSIRNHELGQRHKDNVAKRLTSMRQEKTAKEKEQKEAARSLEQIEAKAKRSYQKDVATFREARDSNVHALVAQDDGRGTAKGSAFSGEWEFDSTSGYYYNQSNGCSYDPNSGFYYTDALGKWVTQEEAFAASQVSSDSKQRNTILKKPLSASENNGDAKCQSGPPSGRVVSASLNPMRSIKGAPSSLSVNKRKRPNEKPRVVSEEEAAAVKAREAARKRVEEREKSLLGLYRH